jgi:hypothetical protein
VELHLDLAGAPAAAMTAHRYATHTYSNGWCCDIENEVFAAEGHV